MMRIFLNIKYNIKIEGKENRRKNACIYVANHRSFADPPLVGVAAKGRFAFMAKEELFRNKFFGALLRTLGAFPVSRGKGDTSVIDYSVECIKKGRNLAIFPEGTRSKDGKVGRGKGGAALVAAKTGALIIPVGIIFQGEKLRFRTKIRIVFGEAINPADYLDLNSEEIKPKDLSKLRTAYMTEIKKLVGQEDTE